MSCIVCTARIRGLDPPEDPVTGPLAEGPRGAILAAPDRAGSRRAQLDTSGSDTAATLTSVTGSGDERDAGATISAARPVHPYVHVVIVAVIGAVAVFAWLMVLRDRQPAALGERLRHREPLDVPGDLPALLVARRAPRQVPPRPDEPRRIDARQPVRGRLEDRLAVAPGHRRDGPRVAVLGRRPRTRGRDRRDRLARSRRSTTRRSRSRPSTARSSSSRPWLRPTTA